MKTNIFSVFRRKVYNYYNNLPNSAKHIMSVGMRLIPDQMLLGPDFQKTRHLLRSTEYLSEYLMKRDIVDKRLSGILIHAYNNTKYYNKLFMSLGFDEQDIIKSPTEILKKLPFVDKAKVRDNYHDFLSNDMNKITSDYTSTGGTSGEPFYFHINSDRSPIEWAYIVNQWERVGFNLKSKRATFRGARIKNKNGWEDDLLTRERKFSSFELTDEYFDKIWPMFCAFLPDFIYAYPSTAISLCKYIERTSKKLPESIKAILIGSENIYDGQEEYIENISGRRIFKWYGHSEKLVLGGECEKSKYYHAYPQYGYVEFINQYGNPARPGEFAEIVGTGFINSVLPFIRYRTGDFCTYLGSSCPECGRSYPIFDEVKGRWTQEVLYGIKKNSICMSAINVHSDNFKNVYRYQFYQNQYGKALLKIMPKRKFTEKDKSAIVREFNQKFSGNVEVEAIVVNNIPLTKNGKYKYIDQKLSHS